MKAIRGFGIGTVFAPAGFNLARFHKMTDAHRKAAFIRQMKTVPNDQQSQRG
jgi:hypothetical protein